MAVWGWRQHQFAGLARDCQGEARQDTLRLPEGKGDVDATVGIRSRGTLPDDWLVRWPRRAAAAVRHCSHRVGRTLAQHNDVLAERARSFATCQECLTILGYMF